MPNVNITIMRIMEVINLGKSLELIETNSDYGKSLMDSLRKVEISEEDSQKRNYIYVDDHILPSKVKVSSREFRQGKNKDISEEVYRELELRTTSDAFRKGIRALRAVLYTCSVAYSQEGCVAYVSSSDQNWRYDLFTVNTIREVIQTLAARGYGHIEKGDTFGFTPYRFFPSEDKSDLWSTLYAQICVGNIAKNVVVRTSNGNGWNEIKDREYKLPIVLREKEQQVIKYKEYMLDKYKPVQVLDKDGRLISLQSLHRQFHSINDKSDRYLPDGVKKNYLWGRLSGSRHINMDKGDRKLISIDGESVVALDFRTAQVQLSYKCCDLDISEEDGYLIKSCSDRETVKNLFTSFLGRTNRIGLIGTLMNKEFIKDVSHAHMVVDELIEKHEDISHLFFVGVNEYLTRLESDLIMDIMSDCVDINIPVLTVHDEVICKKSDMDKVRLIMSKYLKHIN
jgi:hypothetical protein